MRVRSTQHSTGTVGKLSVFSTLTDSFIGMANTLIFSYFMETLSTVYGMEIKVKCDTIKLTEWPSNVPVIAVMGYQCSIWSHN